MFFPLVNLGRTDFKVCVVKVSGYYEHDVGVRVLHVLSSSSRTFRGEGGIKPSIPIFLPFSWRVNHACLTNCKTVLILTKMRLVARRKSCIYFGSSGPQHHRRVMKLFKISVQNGATILNTNCPEGNPSCKKSYKCLISPTLMETMRKPQESQPQSNTSRD